MRIDAHHHFWVYDPVQYPWISESMAALRNDFLPAKLRDVADHAGIEGVVSVQARQSLEETEWLLQFAQQYELVRGVVGWAPLASDSVGRQLEQWTHHGWLKSIRHVVQDEADGFLDSEAFNQGVGTLHRYDLAYDLLIYGRQLKEAIRFVDRHPKVRIILDHIAKPSIHPSAFDHEWEKQIVELAKRPNVACKFSGVLTEFQSTNWSVEEVKPYWNVAWEAFGAQRLMFGSDWPVCLLRANYSEWIKVCNQLTSSLSETEQEAFWGNTAIHWYQL